MTLIFMKRGQTTGAHGTACSGALATLTLLFLFAVLPQSSFAQRAASRTGVSADYQVGAVVIQVYDVNKGSETIAELEPGGTVTLNPGQKARLRIAVKTRKGSDRSRYPRALFVPARPLTAITPIRTGEVGGFTFLSERRDNRRGRQVIDYEITDPDYAVPSNLVRGQVFVELAEVEPPKPAPEPPRVDPLPDTPTPERLGVTLFEDSGFRGRSERLYSSDRNLRDNVVGNDRLSSIEVDRGCVARLFEASEYRGDYAEVRFDLGDFESIGVRNDHVSSIQIDCSEDATRYDRDQDQRERYDRERSDRDREERDRYDRERGDRDFRQGVTLYSDSNFRGDLTFFRDGSYPDLRRTEVGEKRASSIAVSRGCVAVLYEYPDFRGRSVEVDGDLDSLSRTQLGSDAVASVRVLCR